MLVTRLDSSDSIRLIPMNEEDVMSVFLKGEVAGVLVVPVGFSERAEAGNVAQLNLIAGAGSANGQALYQLLRVPISRNVRVNFLTDRDAGDLWSTYFRCELPARTDRHVVGFYYVGTLGRLHGLADRCDRQVR